MSNQRTTGAAWGVGKSIASEPASNSGAGSSLESEDSASGHASAMSAGNVVDGKCQARLSPSFSLGHVHVLCAHICAYAQILNCQGSSSSFAARATGTEKRVVQVCRLYRHRGCLF